MAWEEEKEGSNHERNLSNLGILCGRDSIVEYKLSLNPREEVIWICAGPDGYYSSKDDTL